MSEHTPGPWYHDYETPLSVREKTGRHQVALVNPYRDEYIANARLIAAAPEMLEALIDIRDANTIEDGEDAINAMHAAIDKATGTTPPAPEDA